MRWAESVAFPALALDVKAEGDAVLDGEALLAGEFGVTGVADAVPDVDMDVVIVGEVVPTVPTLSMAVTVTDGVRVLEGDADAVRVGAGEIHIRNDAVAVLEGCTGQGDGSSVASSDGDTELLGDEWQPHGGGCNADAELVLEGVGCTSEATKHGVDDGAGVLETAEDGVGSGDGVGDTNAVST